jgi:cobalt-zinc-cadmium efflux system protein
MSHDHGHHHHIDPEAGDVRVAAAVAINLCLTVAQFVGGLVAGSLALVADAIHNLSDALSLIIAFAARRIARRPADDTMTFGYGRAEVVAALVNLTTLIVIGLFLVYEGITRLFDPPEVEGWIVVVLAGVALVVDLATVLLTIRMAKTSMNIRAAFLHNLADALGSVAVIVAGTLILLYDWRLVDPIVTLGISAYILWHAGSELPPVIRLLMLGAPGSLDTEAVRGALSEIEGVRDVHHVHLWQIDEDRSTVEAHLVVSDLTNGPAICRAAKGVLQERFAIGHSTLEVEHIDGACGGPAPRTA